MAPIGADCASLAEALGFRIKQIAEQMPDQRRWTSGECDEATCKSAEVSRFAERLALRAAIAAR